MNPRRLGPQAFWEEMRAAYATGNIVRLARTYAHGFRQPGLALPLRVFESLFPAKRILQIAVQLEHAIASRGLADASDWLLNTYIVRWECALPTETSHTLRTEPLLIYGNHPSMLTPFLVAAAVRRSDLRIVSSNRLHHLLPSYAPHSLPVERRSRGWRDHYSRGGISNVLVTKLLARLHPLEPVLRVREANRRALEFGASHVASGGSLLIAPEGGAAHRRPWHVGLGVIAQGILERDPQLAPYVLPYWERHSSNRRIFAHLRAGPVSQAKLRWVYRRPVTMTFSVPVRLVELTGGSRDPHELTERLRRHYCEVFPEY